MPRRVAYAVEGRISYSGAVAMTSFEDFLHEVRAEAEADGPAAVEELRRLEHRFRLAGQLVALCRARAVSQAELAQLSGVPQNEVSRVERGVGNPTLDTLVRLGGALGAHLAFVADAPPAPA